ncbi:MAG: ATPase [Rhizobiales bacterium]|nr:ATPase [Hyphomicrobiales bacterium]
MSDVGSKTDIGTDAMAQARAAMAIEMPKRFYKQVETKKAEGGFQILLDGRRAKTPAKTPYSLPHEGLAADMAKEWSAQETHILSATMPLTRLVNSAMDNVGQNRAGVIDEIVGYAETDMLFYRVESPVELVGLQKTAWDSVLELFAGEMSAVFTITEGIAHVKQPNESVSIIRQYVEKTDEFTLAAIATLTNLTGSVLLPVAFRLGWIDQVALQQAAHVDEDWQISQWGPDDEAEARRAYRIHEMAVACRLIGQLIEKAD